MEESSTDFEPYLTQLACQTATHVRALVQILKPCTQIGIPLLLAHFDMMARHAFIPYGHRGPEARAMSTEACRTAADVRRHQGKYRNGVSACGNLAVIKAFSGIVCMQLTAHQTIAGLCCAT